MPQFFGRCIFCRGRGLSKEHLFADWLRDIFPRTASDTHTFGVIDWTPGPRLTKENRQGHSGSTRARIVCRHCNNGWMNHIDDAAKWVATPIILGEQAAITPAMQRVMATWFAKIAIVGDSINRNGKKSAIIQSQREWFKDHKEPHPLWEVWIGTYGGTDWRELGIFQHGGFLNLPAIGGPTPISGYIETTVMGMGDLFALVLATDIAAFGFDIGSAKGSMRKIWPTGDAFNWPFASVMTDEQARAVQFILRTMLARPIGVGPG